MNISSDEIERYAQQIKLESIGLSGQKKLKRAKVLCVGAGGLGSSLLMYLAAAGVGTIGIVDDDVIELNNLQRQILYRSSSINEYKVTYAKQQLIDMNPHVDIHIYPEKLTLTNAQRIIEQYDIIADCSDNFATRYLINDVCFYANKPYVFASVSKFQGQCAVFLRENHACFRCIFPDIPLNNVFADCNNTGVLGTLPGILGTMQATEIIKWLLNTGELLIDSLLVIDILNMSFKKYRLVKNVACRLCVNHESIASLQS